MTRQLSYSQARRCELALGKTCKCRCAGLLHGALRGSEEELDSKEFYYELDDLDPHHIDSKEQRKEKEKRWLKIMENIINGKLLEYGAFKFIQSADYNDSIFECKFCGGYYKLDTFKVISKSNYRNGWLHDCVRAKLVTTEYNAYKSMLGRCYNRSDPQYDKIGAKGIVVKDSWKDSFENFIIDMGFKPNPNVRLARSSSIVNYEEETTYWYDPIARTKVERIAARMLQTRYKFNGEWYRFWLVEYDYGRPSKVLRTEDYQAPMTMLDGDFSFSRIIPCPELMVNKWLAKFGEKFGYQNARQIDNGKSEYIEDSLLPLQPIDSTS
jgi:hypothetical protein